MRQTGATGRAFALPEMPREDPKKMALLLGALFVAGAVLGVVTLLLPHPHYFNDPALFSNCALALGAGVALIAAAGRLPRWSLMFALAFGSLAIGRAIYYSHEPSAYYTFFYLWSTLYSFYFFGRFWGLVQMAVTGAVYAWVLYQVSVDTPMNVWLMVVGSLTVAGLLVDNLAGTLRRREAESSSQAQALAAVGTVAHELSMRTTMESTAAAICEAAVKVAGASSASVWQPLPDASGLEATAATDPEIVGARVLLIGPPSGAIRAFNTREPFFVSNAAGSRELNQDLVDKLGVASVLFQPIMRNQSPTGVLTIIWDQVTSDLSEETRQIVALLAAEGSVAFDRAELMSRLERAARTDDLTGLPNRRAWDEYLARELAHGKRLGTPICVAMLDLDHFKEYNDRHGHQAGDRFLKQAAGAWQGRTRKTDLIARYGGEEFAIALVDCGLEEAAEMLDQLRLVTPQGESSSVGLVAWNGEEDEVALVARADAALYEAKRTGRNQVVVA